MIKVILISTATIVSLLSLNYFILPYVWICLAWLIVALYAMKTSKNSNIKAIWFNLSFLLVVLGLIESFVYLQFTAKQYERRNQMGQPRKLAQPHDLLGYAAKKNQVVFSRMHYRDELVFDVVYTINANGLRISPSDATGTNPQCILFFGGSFTFGTGVNDHETIPYITGKLTRGKFRIYNFGFPGYGAHQMLALSENSILKDKIKCQPKYVIYQAIFDHVRRSAGLARRDKSDPKYIFNNRNEVVYKGSFADNEPPQNFINTTLKILQKNINKSMIVSKIFHQRSNVSFEQVDLMIGIVNAARKNFEEAYPESEFHVIFWDIHNIKKSHYLVDSLTKTGLVVHLISDIFQEKSIEKIQEKYKIKYDGHPNQLAYRNISEYVVNSIVEE